MRHVGPRWLTTVLAGGPEIENFLCSFCSVYGHRPLLLNQEVFTITDVDYGGKQELLLEEYRA